MVQHRQPGAVAERHVDQRDVGHLMRHAGQAFGEIRGHANISTRAGEIVIGKVTESCEATSQGGPINLGDIAGDLQARTGAGDIHVRAARSGGVINTEGGSVHVLHAGGPIDIRSGGGDITLRNAASRVRAQTKQGDINITVDPKLRTTAIDASTIGGNVILNVPPGFAGDFDISIVTSNADADRIHLDVKGLTIQRDQFAGRIRIRARGQVNGGGEKVQIVVDGGDVHVRTAQTGALAMKQK